ncbi:MAG: response regulator [Planctomycetes bacterium]|nr:response regulator [Planctomycetota bacterium]
MADPVFDIFREEARDHLAALEKGFLDLEAAPDTGARRTLIDNLFRHAHSLKSDAKVVGLSEMKQAAQTLEDVLDELRDAPERVDRAAIDQGLEFFDRVRSAFEAWQRGGAAPAEKIEDVSPQPPPKAEPPLAAKGTPKPEETPAAAMEESFTVKVPSDRLDRMLNLTGELRILQRSAGAVSEQLSALREHWEAIGKGASQHSPARRQALEAAVDELRRVEGSLRGIHTRQEMLAESLETDIRQARLLPLAMLADALRRVVRDLGQSLGKEIRYEADVGRIMLDKAVIEALRDPLTHLVRNAADHGLESPAERKAADKPEAGTVRIFASQRGPMVRIIVSDDGRGVNFEHVRRRLRQAGTDDEHIAAMTEQDLTQCLFRPGFSTAAAGEISGRGVGLDVVLETMRRLQGSVELQSQSQAGARFVLTVPVTVATVRILTVLVGGQYYGVPSTSVVETGRAAPEDLRDLEGSRILRIDGQPVRWLSLADMLEAAPAPRPAGERAWPYLLIERQGKRLAIGVDELDDESEVLLKPLGFPLQGLPGVLGAAMRADGAVQLVLDLAGPAFTAAVAAPAVRRAAPAPKARILIVDDSPTTRAVLRNVFTAAGYAVRTATDGMDALERLRIHPADLVITDVEMPRLGGFDLTRQIKSRYGLPVILVTGREKEEHRREGLAAGADAYVVKSTFEGEGLLDIVRQLV